MTTCFIRFYRYQVISAYELAANLIKELENSNYIRKYVKKPVHMDRLIELVAEMVC